MPIEFYLIIGAWLAAMWMTLYGWIEWEVGMMVMGVIIWATASVAMFALAVDLSRG